MRPRLALTSLIALAWVSGCSDTPCATCPPPPPSSGLVVSDPIPSAAAAFRNTLATSPTAGDSAVYVALLPGTVPAGSYATIQVAGDPNTVTTAVINGGFDPVPLRSGVNDVIDVVVHDGSGVAVKTLQLSVAASRPPIIVRTEPPPRKRDQPFNASLVVVFSEPVAAATVSASSVQLFQGSTQISGNVHLLQGYTASAVFEPSQPLQPNTDYRLVVKSSVRDLSGDALATANPVDFTTGTTSVGFVTGVYVLPDTAAILVGSQLQLAATAHDSFGVNVPGYPITWSSDNSAVATVSVTGLVTAVATGTAHISADGGVATVMVTASLAPVHSVTVTPETTTVPVGAGGGSVRLTAVMRDSAGTVLPFRSVSWTTSSPAIATVSGGSGGEAWVTGHASGTATITATSEGHSDSARIALIIPGPFATIIPGYGHTYGGSHTCAVTTDAWVLCWGGNEQGQLGTGAVPHSYKPMGVGGMKFAQVSTQSQGTVCGLTPGGAAFCWGENSFGSLGIGTIAGPEYCGVYLDESCSLEPLAVKGGLQFSAIGVGNWYTCGLTTSGAAYCWGFNNGGQLGIGTEVGPEQCVYDGNPPWPCSTVPVAVTGGLTFTALVVGTSQPGADNACGLTAAGAAFCWGSNNYGQLGDSTRVDPRMSPVPVVGGLTFVRLSAGGRHTCGVTADSLAYCWGDNENGQLGTGDTTNVRLTPGPVMGGLHFATITAGAYHTCGLTGNGAAYCWGANWSGWLGDGTPVDSKAPVPVTGGLTFTTLAAGMWNTCGVTVAGVAYCWGDNHGGQLGDGSTADSAVPVKVAGQP